VCAAGAKTFNKKATVVADDGEGGSYLNSSTWVLVTSDQSLTEAPTFIGANMYPPNLPAKFRPWTDDYSNIWQILSLNYSTAGWQPAAEWSSASSRAQAGYQPAAGSQPAVHGTLGASAYNGRS